ncbi:hypothetical protein HWV07_17820 [Natronomonas salina]|uniref:hypothetical protein n=1 Tax=Natronomonas salina TaxID=1710540 RepID=UPI0015B64098|nr:hypothetical protein [Natronomonas salina]QLD90800.1 hypothetical protein HWV07_17820 [Natronomonas salina]
MRQVGIALSVALLFVASATAVVGGDPPRPGTTNSSLSESEEATLWARQPTEAYVSNDAYQESFGENRTTIHQVANGTDLTFTEPPSTASRWTRFAHGEFEPGDASTSRYPPTANTTNGTYIKDAHATIFAVSPSTRAHVAPGDERFYVPTEGEVLGLVDYRLAGSGGGDPLRLSDSMQVAGHEVSETRLYADGEAIANGSGSHRPALKYATDSASNLTLEAEITVTIVPASGGDATVANGTIPANETGTDVLTETVTVRDTIAVDLYDLRASVHYAEYPSGETGVSIHQTEPWQGYTLDESGDERVRGVWRFFTARNPEWDQLVESNSTDSRQVDSDVLPVFVHAYPSKLGPRAKPEHAGPTIIRTWGEQRRSPAGALPENVTVDVVNESYEPTYGLAIESRAVDTENLTVHGIVHGTKAKLLGPLEDREIRESDLTTEIVDENESGITVLVTLREAESGDPIVLADDDRIAPIADLEREGYVEIDGQRVKTNATGEAVVHLTEQGVYTARYEPASWLDSYPVYAGDSAMVRWHALGSIDGWLELFVRTGLLLAPFLVVWYAGRQLGSMFEWRRY